MKNLKALDKAQLIARIAVEEKGEDIVLMDMRSISTVFDWFVLVSATSSRRIGAIAKILQKRLSKDRISPLHIEGKQNPQWTLLDYEDVVVHIFHKHIRDYYGLEQLWADVPKERINSECMAKTLQKKLKKTS